MKEILRIIFIFGSIILLFSTITIFKEDLMLKQPLISITGNIIGTANVTIISVVEITLVTNSVNFGTVTAGSSKNTTTNNPPPFLLRNDGSVKVNVTIARSSNSTALFNGTGGGDNTTSFQFEAAVATEGISADPACSISTWTNIPGTNPLIVLCRFNYVDNNDEAEIELLIRPPSDEPPGTKSESLVFIASEA
ncbi:MAG: hypothetical protein KJ623_01535 [Nanoarchaeota archaeon]|nr:hypothetical protein [Nanoarchaeota archaeon]MBU0962848.1 hypothetical protein [Nanoarchaeota archaeon]